MYKGYKVIDADSHTMEPDELWDKYVEPEFRPWAPGGSKRLTPNIRPGRAGTDLRDLTRKGFAERPAYINDGEGGIITYEEAYRPYIEREFDTQSYISYMDAAGIDLMVLYPTAALGLTTVSQRQSPKVAAALYKAYNNWLYDFCDQSAGRLLGAGGVDLRDAEAAALEARRCVKE